MSGFIKRVLESRQGQTCQALISLVLGLYSVSSMLATYTSLEANAGDVTNVFSSWSTKPIVDVRFLIANGTCPTTHPVVMNNFTFPGVESGLCACKYGATYRGAPQSSSTSACNTNQTNAGCKNERSIPAIQANAWEGSLMVCGKRGGEAAVPSTSPYRARPQPSASTPSCPSGYKMCGNSTAGVNSSICFPSASSCPVTSLYVVAGANFFPNNLPSGSTYLQLPGSTSYAVASSLSGELPLVDTTTGFTSVCVGETDAYDYKRGVANIDGKMERSTYCPSGRTEDKRFKVFLTASQSSILRPAFNSTSGFCDSTGRQQSSVSISGNCGNSDTICRTVTQRTRCDQLLSYDQGDKTNTQLKIMFRREVPWSADCPITRQELVGMANPLANILSQSLTVTVINVITNIIGILIYVNLLLNLQCGNSPCCPFEEEREKTLLKTLKTYVDTGAKALRFIPISILAQATFNQRTFWESLSRIGCTDVTTTGTLLFLSDRLSSAYTSYAVTAAVDALSLALSFYHLIKHFCCPAVEELEDGGEKDGSEGGSPTRPVEAADVELAGNAGN